MNQTITDILSDWYEISLEDMQKTPKELVLQEDSHAKCVKRKGRYYIKGEELTYAKARTEEKAWLKAICKLLGWKRLK